MTFPSRGCRPCKQRRVKVRLKKTTDLSTATKNSANTSSGTATADMVLFKAQKIFTQPSLDASLEDQALTYYTRCYVEGPQDVLEIMDGHTKVVPTSQCYSDPSSVLSLAISAVAHATFARAQRSQFSLAKGYQSYSKALCKTNLALKDPNESKLDDVLLAAMLLSFYENSVVGTTPEPSKRGIGKIASRSFAHHDGAMAMLNLRRQQPRRQENSVELDKLVRRQLVRSLLLRSMPVPPWLRDGAKYGEIGSSLELDRCMVETARLKHRFNTALVESFMPGMAFSKEHFRKCRSLLTEGQALEASLASWADRMSSESCYSTLSVKGEDHFGVGSKLFRGTVHIYPTAGHAGMWNRYRALRLISNDIIARLCTPLIHDAHPTAASIQLDATLQLQSLADDLSLSIPYMLGLVEVGAKQDTTVLKKVPSSLKIAVKASTASFLAWPLAMATMVVGLPNQHRLYLKDRLLDVSDIADDGVLEKIAAGFAPT
ncbi:uncharacterized protein KY384_006709 [Bacidia gigantensis]|uniref:uncharacterized protein n=1 Tax=Bacidia gigantensis TaxID=2732470 RepID=UPI001D059DAC|nr:uncharacterized protein KY384_006709 [Bacidia gigantensis]KAG8529019.1 hypothetical protein KY384_006709 [Bacidia gigantensis]